MICNYFYSHISIQRRLIGVHRTAGVFKSNKLAKLGDTIAISKYETINKGKVLRDAIAPKNKLAKLGDAIAITKSETITHSLTDPLTDGGSCYRI